MRLFFAALRGALTKTQGINSGNTVVVVAVVIIAVVVVFVASVVVVAGGGFIPWRRKAQASPTTPPLAS